MEIIDMNDEILTIDSEFLEYVEKEISNLTDENISKIKEIALKKINANNLHDMEMQEKAIIKLANIYCKKLQDENLNVLFPILYEFIKCKNKARTARLLRVVLDIFLESNIDKNEAIVLCKECVNWAKDDKKTYLCQIFEIKLTAFYYETLQLNEAVEIGGRLVEDLKKMSYKDELIEILIVMCRVYFLLGNFQKCRGLLTCIKTTANTTHLSTKLQAHIDLLSGSIHCKEYDYVTAYSFFYEAFELFDSIESRYAVKALKYMLFCKIMVGRPEDVHTVLSGKLSLKYCSRQLDAMKAAAEVFKHKNLHEMKNLLQLYQDELVNDSVVKVHLEDLHDTLFENNLLVVIEPYSIVEISYIAHLVKMEVHEVINRIARMILDSKLNATLDQGFGTLQVFPFKKNDDIFKKCITSINSLNNIVEILKLRKPIEI